ncbi:DNA polymerase IV [candidate division WOR-3 bacterium]|nr:DNA polymerase IV [candidate division WOR-3 bacterium]
MILLCDIDAFFASVEAIKNPSLRGKPIIVGGDTKRGVAATASYEARRYGIHSGMPLYLARKLCPHCIFLRGNFADYEKFSDKFFKVLERFSPSIERASLDEAYLDISGTERLFGPPLKLGSKIKYTIEKDTGLNVTIGIGISKLVAKLAASTVKPDGLIYIPREKTSEFLKYFPLKETKWLGSINIDRLQNMGINTVGEMLSLSPSILSNLLDRNGLKWLGLLKDGGITTVSKRKSYSRETTLYENTADRNFILSILFYLVERAVSAMRSDGYLTTKVSVKLRFSDFKTITRGKSVIATDISAEIFKLCVELLDGLIDRYVRLIGVKLEGIIPHRPLFEDQKMERLENSVKKIREKYGFTSIQPLKVMEMNPMYKKRKNEYILRTPSCSH